MANGPPTPSRADGARASVAAAAAAEAAGASIAAANGGDDDNAPPPCAVPGPLRLTATLKGHTRSVACLKLSPLDARVLASASADFSVRLWRLPAAGDGGAADGGDDDDAPSAETARLTHPSGVNAVAWGPCGDVLASVSDDTAARLWDVETGALLRALPGHTNYASCCSFDPAGRILVTGSYDETVRFWDVRQGRLLREIPAHSDPVTALSFTRDGTVLATGSSDGLVRLWDAFSGHCLRSYASCAGSAPVNDVVFAPNDKYYLQATMDSRVRLVHVESGRCVKTYQGHRNVEYCCGTAFVAGLPAYSEADDTAMATDSGGGGGGAGGAGGGGGFAVASGSEDGSLVVWDLDSRKVRQRELGAGDGGRAHGGPVISIAAHPSLPLVLTGARQEGEAPIKVWRAD